MPLSYIFLGWFFTVSTALATGALLLHLLKLRFTWPMAFILGACPVSLLVTLLGFSGLIYQGVFATVCIAVMAACIHLRAYRSIDTLQITEKWFWAGFIPFGLIYLVHAVAPEISPDGMAYHLHLVDRYNDAHALIPIRENMYASLSQGGEMLFLFAYSFGKHSAAALVHFTYLIALPLLIVDYATRKGWAFAGAFAGLIFFATPVVGIDGASAYNDVMIAAVWFALFVLTEEFEPSRILPAGMLAGFAYSVKYTAVTAILFLLWRWRKHWRSLLPACVAIAVFILPWVLKNWIWIGNPFAPFFNSWFPNAYVTVDFERSYSANLRHYGLEHFSDRFSSVMLSGYRIGGFLGPVWFLAPLGILQTAWIFPALTYPFNIDSRFLISVLPFLALGIGKVVARWKWLAISICGIHLFLAGPAASQHTAPFGWKIHAFPWEEALRLIPEDQYLSKRRPEYLVARLVEKSVPAGEQVYSYSSIAESYTKRTIRSRYYSADNLEFQNILEIPVNPDLQPTHQHQIRLATPRKTVRVAQPTSGTKDVWSIAEIEPKPVNIRASTMPFHLDRAIDGNPMTRWNSGFPLKPMWIELEFDHAVDTVTLWMDGTQSNVKLETEGATVTNTRRQFSSPWPTTRRWATETVRSMGIRYLLIDQDTFQYQDFIDHADEWNLETIGTSGPTTLLRIR